jgi:hypothetical protein
MTFSNNILNSNQKIYLTKNQKLYVLQSQYWHLHQLMTIAISTIKPDQEFTLKYLFGPEFWEDLYSPGMRKINGVCVSMMVNEGQLPLRVISKKSKYPKKYALK